MLRDEKYLLGTAEEIADWLVSQTTLSDSKQLQKFTNIDYATTGYKYNDTFGSIKMVYAEAFHWYGLKKVDTGFSSGDMELVSNYYGGGAGAYTELYAGQDTVSVKNEILRLIKHPIESDEGDLNNAELLIVEILQQKNEPIGRKL